MPLSFEYTDDRPAVHREGRAADPLRAPVAEAVASMTVGGQTLVVSSPEDDTAKVVRFARQAGRDLGFTVRAVVETGSKKGTNRISLWAVPLQTRPRKSAAADVEA